jgi:hypothetical protein
MACTPFYGKDIEGQYSYEHHNGHLIYAFVKASSEEEAHIICERMINTFMAAHI